MTIEWIEKGLEKPGKSRSGLARAMKRAPSAITSLLKGERQLKANEVPLIAAYLEVEPPPLLAVAEQNEIISTIAITGEVAIGVWREGGLGYEREEADYTVSARWPREALLLMRVRGSHINRKARDGDLILCLKTEAAPRPPMVGDWLVVERVRNGLAETSVRRVVAGDDGELALEADSEDPAFSGFLRLGTGGAEWARPIAYVLQFIRSGTEF